MVSFHLCLTPYSICKSIFNSFVEKDFGNSIDDFEFEAFLNYEEKLHQECKLQTSDGKTFPVFMNKKWFMIIGGLDPLYPSPYVCDWDFFVKLELLGISCVRDYSTHFYHFGGKSTKFRDDDQSKKISMEMRAGEDLSHEFFKSKWGFTPTNNLDNSKTPKKGTGVIKGIKF